MNLVSKLNKKVEELTKKEFPTAEEAWSQSNYGRKSLEEVQKFEEDCLYDAIQDAINSKENYCFYALNPSINYENIKLDLSSHGYGIFEYDQPFKYWVITWKLQEKFRDMM